MPDERLRQWLEEQDPELLLADGFDAAIIGVAERCSQPPLVVYDAEKCIELLEKEGLDHDSAVEYFSFNTLGAWVGDRTPLFLWRPPDRE